MKKIGTIGLVLVLCICLLAPAALADSTKVITLGADLTQSQRAEMLQMFGEAASQAQVPVMTVTNAEERHYLSDIVSAQVIGDRAISSASVEYLGDNQGISVETHNITWVTPDMLKNALVTAGVKDAKVIVAAPFPVSGTAALTGILKAFEKAKGTAVSEAAKEAANKELVVTGQLGDDLNNKEKAAELIASAKQKVVEAGTTDPATIRGIVEDVAKQMNITLTQGQIDEIVKLFQQVGGLNLSLTDLKSQLGELNAKVDQLINDNGEIKSMLAKIQIFVEQIWEKINALIDQKTA